MQLIGKPTPRNAIPQNDTTRKTKNRKLHKPRNGTLRNVLLQNAGQPHFATYKSMQNV